MVIFINGSFGVGKTTVARVLARELERSAVLNPEPFGVLLSHVSRLLPLAVRTDDFQDLAAWRSLSARAIRFAHRFRGTIVVPMAFSNLSYLNGFLSHLRGRGIPTLHFCLVAPYAVVLERMRSRQEDGPTPWQLRRSAECCDAHGAPEFAEQISTVGRSAEDVAREIAARVSRSTGGTAERRWAQR